MLYCWTGFFSCIMSLLGYVFADFFAAHVFVSYVGIGALSGLLAYLARNDEEVMAAVSAVALFLWLGILAGANDWTVFPSLMLGGVVLSLAVMNALHANNKGFDFV